MSNVNAAFLNILIIMERTVLFLTTDGLTYILWFPECINMVT